jgi:branched-chain amino acid transport system substrate-binding protein/neutral amino acid transport system substrate-binding protein
MIGTAASAGGSGLQDFKQKYSARYQRQPKIYDPNTWDAAALLVLAAEAAKTPTGTGIRDKLRQVANPPGEEVTDVCRALALIREGRKINYQGASGTVDFSDQGDVTGSYDIWTIQPDGELKVIGAIAVTGSEHLK